MPQESGLEQWAREDYDAATQSTRNRIDLSTPDRAEVFIRQATRFLAHTLGLEWLQHEVDPTNRSGYMLIGRGSPAEDVTRVERNQRFINLAISLYNARHICGFDHLATELKTRDLYDAVAELRAVTHMLELGEDAWFIDPTARLGHTYDGIVLIDGTEVAAEVKTRKPQPIATFRPSLIENSLNTARKQLPPDMPSIIYLHIASPWTDDIGTMRTTNNTITQWLKGTGRVNAVYVLLERTFTRPHGTSLARGGSLITNPAARHPVTALNG